MTEQDLSASMPARAVPPSPDFNEQLRTWARIGVLSFGGPAAQIALMHRIVVDEKKWLSETQYLNALSFCMLLPGPEAMQLATYAGWRMGGLKGGLAAGLLFVLPGAAIVLALAMIYAAFGHVPIVAAIFFGIKAAVLVIVIEALHRISKRALTRPEHWAIAGLSFVAIFFVAVPFPLLVLAAAAYGFLDAPDTGPAAPSPTQTLTSPGATMARAGAWLAVWVLPLAALTALLGREHVVSQLAWFFSKLALVTFGGAYAMLAYMGQDVVVRYGWLSAGQMMDGLGLAETTPGPLILVTEFVGYLAAYEQGGGAYGAGPSLLMGLLGALVALWATFVPSFLWIFAGAPYLDWIIGQPRLKGALSAITAAVVGVILNLAVWFGLHVFFKDVTLVEAGWVRLWTPTLSSLDWQAVAIAAVAAILLLRQHWGIGRVLIVASALGVAIKLGGL